MENEQVEQVETMKARRAHQAETNKKLSKYAGLGAAMAPELMIGFWFGIGAILAIKMVSSMEELIRR